MKKYTRKMVIEQLKSGNKDFSGCDLSNLKLKRVNFRYANLSNANLTGTILTNANLMGANLTGANLQLANLSEAILWGANLQNVDLRGAIGNMEEICNMQFDDLDIVFTRDILAIDCVQHTHEQWHKLPNSDIDIIHMDLRNKWKDHIFKTIELCFGENK